MSKNIHLIPVSDVKERDHPHFPLKLSDRFRKDERVTDRYPQFEIVNFIGEGVLRRYAQLEESNSGDLGYLITRENVDHTLEPVGIGTVVTRELTIKKSMFDYPSIGQFTLLTAVVTDVVENFNPAMVALVKEAENYGRSNIAALEPAKTDDLINSELTHLIGEILHRGVIKAPGVRKGEMNLFAA